MSMGQTFLTVGALAIFGYLALNVNRMNLDALVFSIEQQRDLDAIHVGQSLTDRLYSIPYPLIDLHYAALNDVTSASARMQHITTIGDTLYTTFQISNTSNVFNGLSGKVIRIHVFRRINDEFEQRAGFILTRPQP